VTSVADRLDSNSILSENPYPNSKSRSRKAKMVLKNGTGTGMLDVHFANLKRQNDNFLSGELEASVHLDVLCRGQKINMYIFYKNKKLNISI
jgi:hypothetical protein